MLGSLDPHSNYLNQTDFRELRETSRGAYGGLGLEVTTEDGAVKVITPMDDTPAGRAGVQAGDYITAIDGESVIGKPLQEAVKGMKGTPGSEVTITIAREGSDPFDLKLTRSIAFVRGLAFDEDPSDPVASAQAAFMLDSNAGRKPGANLEPPGQGERS